LLERADPEAALIDYHRHIGITADDEFVLTNEAHLHSDSLNDRLVRYLHDCLAAQTDWARAINVVEQKDVTLVPLAASEQQRFGADGCLKLSDPEAIELAQRVSLGGAHASLILGALFLVGRIRSTDDRAEKRFCAPLLEVPLSIQQTSNGEITLYPDEQEFTVNYGLVGELLRGDNDDLQDRLADLAELVPDFPIDAHEFATFWNGFRMIAPEVDVSAKPPVRRKKSASSTRIADLGLASNARDDGLDNDAETLTLVDFYVPSIPKDEAFRLLPAAAVVLGRKAGQAMSALSELRAMEDMPLSNTALGCLFDPSTARPWSCEPANRVYPDDVQPLPLTPTQEAIVESSRSAPLTVVTGPPGTGKSYTITAIVLDALLNGQTVLVASQMDKAVEVVADKVEQLAGSLAIARSGGRAAQRQLAKKVSRLTGPRRHGDAAATSAVEDCAGRHYELTRQVQQLEQDFHQVIAAEQQWSQSFQSCARSQPLFRIPIEVVEDAEIRKAEHLFDRAHRNLTPDTGWLRGWLARWDLARIRRLLSIPSAAELSMDEISALLQFHLLQVNMREIERSLNKPFPADLIWQELADVERRRQQTAIELLRLLRQKRVGGLVSQQQHRAALRDLVTLLRRRKREIKRQLKQKVSAELLLESFPAWACTSRSLCEILPATPALFDIVVIDEASQCDLALAAVALMRGKRAVVVGDPHQLRHVCFLSRAREQAALVRNKFTSEMSQRFHYRRSLFDVAADTVDQRHFFFLHEHFRSHPQIIEFSNRRFYDGALDIMTSRPPRQPQSAIRIHHVGGQRTIDSSINLTEVGAVVDIVKSITADTNASRPLSIGIVSPFRDHADAIKERLLRECSAEAMAKHSLIVGTAHSLQGDERDVVIFSTSIDARSHPTSLRFLQSPHLFNVAITRARRELICVTSVAGEELPPGLLREFLVHAGQPWCSPQTQEESTCSVEATIAQRLSASEIDIWTGFRSAGNRINVVAMIEDNCLAILCDGGGSVDQDPSLVLTNHRRLARAGWTTCRLPHRTIDADWDSCQQRIVQAFLK
jgi:hypothetical protein